MAVLSGTRCTRREAVSTPQGKLNRAPTGNEAPVLAEPMGTVPVPRNAAADLPCALLQVVRREEHAQQLALARGRRECT